MTHPIKHPLHQTLRPLATTLTLLLAFCGAQAQTSTPAQTPTGSQTQAAPIQQQAQAPAAPSATSAALFQSFGEKPGLVALMDDFMPRLLQHPLTRPAFEPSNHTHVKAQLVEQFCQLLGGPCQYKGPDMKTAHINFEVSKAQFNALVELLQQSMRARGIAFAAQNQLLAKLAPMHRDIISPP